MDKFETAFSDLDTHTEVMSCDCHMTRNYAFTILHRSLILGDGERNVIGHDTLNT